MYAGRASAAYEWSPDDQARALAHRMACRDPEMRVHVQTPPGLGWALAALTDLGTAIVAAVGGRRG